MRRRYAMGTFLSIHIVGENSDRLQDVFLREVQRLEELLSLYRPQSEISRINRAAGVTATQVSPETYEIIDHALRYAELSGGAFDPTAYYAFLPPPSRERVGERESFLSPLTLSRPSATLPREGGGRRSDYRQVHLDPTARTVFLAAPGMRLDLGGIGKGFALDKALARVREEGRPESISADFGGQLLFWHCSGSLGPETIVIENPAGREAALTFQMSSNGSVSTSSNAERSNHLIDPRSGDPARGAASVTVAAPTATEAEALSTALFVLGAPGGEALLNQFPAAKSFICSN